MSDLLWSTVLEAYAGFKEILDKKCPKAMLINFRYTLSQSLKKVSFRDEMSKCGALLNWDSENSVCNPPWTLSTIESAVKAMEKYLKISDSNNNNDKEVAETETTQTNGKTSEEIITEINTPRPVPVMELKPIEEGSEDSSTEEMSTPKLLIKTGYKITTENETPKPTAAPRPKIIPRKINRASSQRKLVLLKSDWHTLVGEYLEFTDPLNYIRIADLLEQPKFTAEDIQVLRPLLPFILQKIKMWNSNILTAENLNELLPITEDEPTWRDDELENENARADSLEKECKKNLQVLSKLDILTLLVSSTEITVLTDIFQNISKFPIALPIILPNPIANEIGNNHMVLPALTKCLIKWEHKGRRNGENYLFRNPYKLITAIRIGNNDTVGKSSFLNQIFLQSNTFQCRGQPGRGKPIALDGSVEFIWLTKDTCKESIWTIIQTEMEDSVENEIVLLADFHGDALQHQDTLQAMNSITSKFIVFLMPDEAITESRKTLVDICGKENLLFIYVDPKIAVDNSKTLRAHLITDNNETLNKLKQYIKQALKTARIISGENQNNTRIATIPEISIKESTEFLELIHQLNNSGGCVRDLLCLQKITRGNIDQYWTTYKNSPELKQLMSRFIKVLQVPLPERRIGLTHIEQELSILSANKLTGFSVKLASLIDKRNRLGEKDLQLEEINDAISTIYKEFESSLALNDFLRELSIVFEIIMIHGLPEEISMISKLPALYAELLIEGRTLEILDGDAGSVPGIWLEAVCHSVCQKLANLKVFVISILGLQSSGKSTLLNALFGCKFATSVGKCTKGLYMRLMLLEESFQKKLGLDAILVVDTEGLGSPESMMDKNSESKDRTMATFAMTISNLTLINVAGESNKEIVQILQIVILTMARMERTDLSPDILLVQQVPEGGHDALLAKGVDNFCNALEEAVKVIQSREIDLGVRTLRNLRTLKQRLRQREILYQLRPFKSGASPQSPPTEEYCQDVIGLRNRIFKEYHNQKNNFIYFCTWHKLLKGYWQAVQKENFALRFTSIRQVQEFIEVNTRMTSLKNDLTLAFQYHRACLNENITEKLNLLDKQIVTSEFEKEIQDQTNSQIDLVPGDCQSPLQITNESVSCKWCIRAEFSKKALLEFVQQTSAVSVNETEENLKRYIEDLRKMSKAHVLRKFESLKIQLGKASEFDTILHKIMQDSKRTMKIQSQSVDDVWIELQSTVQKRYPISFVKDQVIEDIVNTHRNIPDVIKWKHDLTNMSFSADDPRRTLAVLNVKRRKKIKFANKPDLHLTANEHNWLCGKFQDIAKNIVLNRKDEKSGYSENLIGEHRNKVMDILHKFEERFKTKLTSQFKFDAIFYSLQLFLEMILLLQDDWNREFEPFFILLKQKQEYMKKIGMYLSIQLPTQITSFGASIAKNLLEAASAVCMSSFDVTKYFNKWATRAEGIRLRYLISLAEDLKCGNESVVLGHFQEPQTVLSEWYMQVIDISIKDIVVPMVKESFLKESTEIGYQIANTNSAQELVTFVNWYLNKVGENLALQSVTEEMQEKLKLEIQKQMSKRVKDYSEEITVENLPMNYDDFWDNLGCTATCPGCTAVCWGSKNHENGLTNYRRHFTCHQPKGLSGVVNKDTGELESKTCCQNNEDKEIIEETTSTDTETEETQWLNESHPIDEYNQLMQWFFLKLKGKLTEQFDAKLPDNDLEDKTHLANLEKELDNILSLIRHKSEL